MNVAKSIRYGCHILLLASLAACRSTKSTEAVSTTAPEIIAVTASLTAAPRIEFGAKKLLAALKDAGIKASIVRGTNTDISPGRITISLEKSLAKEGFTLTADNTGAITITGGDDSGVLYGCLELASRIRTAGKLPENLHFADHPAMTLRGTCIGMQKTYILPGRKEYEYPYTPELFPWFYDKELWREYLDFIASNRMNTLYLWSGHPFASLVRLPDYPEALEVPDDVFQRNTEMFHWLTAECDRRGIWLVQMFYNILLPKPLAEKYGVSTQLAAPTPLAADYTRKAIAEFVKQYPHVGLMFCLGEALEGTSNQIAWATQTILPGVHDGMRAAGLTAEPPVVIRTHAMDAETVIPACYQVYSNLFTESKYNGESLTTYEPRGKEQATHLAMAKLGPHIVNVHILANLEPFRYGAQRFIKKCMQASRDRLGASGLHLYPLSYWNWPYSPDIANPPLKQWDRDWIWYEAWARYAWNPDVPEKEDHTYWVDRLADFYGCNAAAAGKILDAYNDAGEVAPILIRRFGITEGNRQTLSLGMTLDQLVNPKKYGAAEELWLSQAPPGERLDEFVRKEWNREKHTGETPATAIRDATAFSDKARKSIHSVRSRITKNQDEFERLECDIDLIDGMSRYYQFKVAAATSVLRFGYSKDLKDMEDAASYMIVGGITYTILDAGTRYSYAFANSMQTGHRKIPFPGAVNGVGTNYHWTQIFPLYDSETRSFVAHVEELKSSKSNGSTTVAPGGHQDGPSK